MAAAIRTCFMQCQKQLLCTCSYFGSYLTRMDNEENGSHPVCQIKAKNLKVNQILTFPDDEKIKFIFSPGIRLDPPQK